MDLGRLKIDRAAASRRGRRPRVVRWLVLAAVAVGAFVLLREPLGGVYDRLTLPAVEVARAVRTSPQAASGTAANGYVVAARRAALSADTPGRVVEMNVQEGSVVRAGDVVARLYAEEYEAALRRAQAELGAAQAAVRRGQAELDAAQARLATQRTGVQAAQARLDDAVAAVERARIDHERFLRLLEQGAGTQQDLDDAKTQLDRAVAGQHREEALLALARSQVGEGESEVQVAEARLRELKGQVAIRAAVCDEAQATLAKTVVRAPFDGVVILKDAEVGEVVSPDAQGGSSRGSVVTMVDFASLEVQVEMPERTLAGIATGARALVFLDAYPDVRYTGAVKRIWPTANRQKGTVEIRIGFDRPDERLRPEMGVRVVFDAEGGGGDGEPEAPVVLVPEGCIARVDGKPGVFALERDRAVWRAVELGDRRGDRVVVAAGLEGGEPLVLRPPAGLEDGARVRPLP